MVSAIDVTQLQPLADAAPELAARVTRLLADKRRRPPEAELRLLVDEALWGLAREVNFGQAVAHGFATLVGTASPRQLRLYRQQVRAAGEKGPARGWAMAAFLAPVLVHAGEGLADRFLQVFAVLTAKGTYALNKPLQALADLLEGGETAAAAAWLDLLGVVFERPLSYNQSLKLTYRLPRAVGAWRPSRRSWQIRALTRVARQDVRLIDPFLDGMELGLGLLGRSALQRFVARALARFARQPDLGCNFLSLASELGQAACRDLQTAALLTPCAPQLNRYLRVRTGLDLRVRPLGDLPGRPTSSARRPVVYSDGAGIFLPPEIDVYRNREDNRALYKALVRLEAGYYEFGTFTFDLEKALEAIARDDAVDGASDAWRTNAALRLAERAAEGLSDLERFAALCDNPTLALDLLTVYEHGRLRRCFERRYPGLSRQVFPVVQAETARLLREGPEASGILLGLYARVAAGMPAAAVQGFTPQIAAVLERVTLAFDGRMAAGSRVEDSARLLRRTWSAFVNLTAAELNRAGGRLAVPFDRRLRPERVRSGPGACELAAADIKRRLAARGLKVYKSDLRTWLAAQKATVPPEEIERRIVAAVDDEAWRRGCVDVSRLSIETLDAKRSDPNLLDDRCVGPAFRYREWDCHLNDYLEDHVRVIERLAPEGPQDFYARTLAGNPGLARRIRGAFELLRPEGLKVLRQWPDGEAFDYRALLDYAVERKAGRTPSERLYIKRVKACRDVAVLLLVDLSRSTANRVCGTEASVLSIEREAIVLLCEALEVVGDAYAIAGFSGTGRLGVDYYRIKDFEAPLDGPVKARIGGMAAQRSTRMGAAVRHATGLLDAVPARVRILMILGDGFPNDLDYKKKYAIEDTRQALNEALGRNIRARAITVNVAADSRLDDLYGRFCHTVISDVRDLPEKLLRVYGALTR